MRSGVANRMHAIVEQDLWWNSESRGKVDQKRQVEKRSLPRRSEDEEEEVAAGFEPANTGFAIQRLRPLGYATLCNANYRQDHSGS